MYLGSTFYHHTVHLRAEFCTRQLQVNSGMLAPVQLLSTSHSQSMPYLKYSLVQNVYVVTPGLAVPRNSGPGQSHGSHN